MTCCLILGQEGRKLAGDGRGLAPALERIEPRICNEEKGGCVETLSAARKHGFWFLFLFLGHDLF